MYNPNTNLWRSYQCNSVNRGWLVAHILAETMTLAKARILDVGCGDGGIAIALAQAGAQVKAVDPDPQRLRKLAEYSIQRLETEITGGETLREPDCFYDAVILNDVLEHTENPGLVLQNCRNCLKPGGVIYITTPNKFSPLNLLCDPHYSLPGLALLSRRSVKRIVAQWLKWLPQDKPDYPQLLSLTQLSQLLQENRLTWRFANRRAAQLAFAEPRALWSRPAHLWIIQCIIRFKLVKFFLTLINDKKGLYNKCLNPNWTILAGQL